MKPGNIFFLIFFLLLIVCRSFSQVKSIKIRIQDNQTVFGDTMYMQVWRNILASPSNAPYKLLKSIPVNGIFEFLVTDVTDMVRISVSKYKNKKDFVPFIASYLAEPGDNIEVKTGKIVPTYKFRTSRDSVMTDETLPNISFSGKGSEKFKCQNEFLTRGRIVDDSISDSRRKAFRLKDSLDYRAFNLQSPDRLARTFDRIYNVQLAEFQILNNRTFNLTANVRAILSKDIIGETFKDLTAAYRDLFISASYFSSSSFKDSLRSILRKTYFSYIDSASAICGNDAIYSITFIEFLVQRALAISNFSYDDALRYLDAHYTSTLKDKLLTSCFTMGFFSYLNNPNNGIEFALKKIRLKVNLGILNDIWNRQGVGKDAFDFQLPNSGNEIVRLESFRGKVVFVDFWFTGCMGCAEYYKSNVSIAEEYFKDSSEVVFVTISIDTDKEVWKRSLAQKIYTSELAVNLYTDGKGAFHPVISNYLVTGYPRPIVIGKGGKIFSNNINDLRGKEAISEKPLLIQSLSRALRQ